MPSIRLDSTPSACASGALKEAERAIEAAEEWMRKDLSSLPSDLATREAIHQELQRVLAGNDELPLAALDRVGANAKGRLQRP